MQDRANAILINASRMDEEFDGIASGLSSAITKDGQTNLNKNIDFLRYRIGVPMIQVETLGAGGGADPGDRPPAGL